MTSHEPVPEPDDAATSALRLLDPGVPAGGTVLQLGSGPAAGGDALVAEDVTVRHAGVSSDDLGGPYDAVLALGVLQHVARTELPLVLGRVAGALRPGGAFVVSLPEGDGEQREVGDPFATVLWREPDLCDLLEDVGLDLARRWATEDRDRHPWLTFETRKGR
jgi:hypothetical protein